MGEPNTSSLSPSLSPPRSGLRTPEQKQASNVPNTPVHAKSVFTPQGKYGNIDEVRLANIEDVGQQVYTISLADYFSRLLPPLDNNDINDVVHDLRTCGILDEHTDEWLHFQHQGRPTDQSPHESIVFNVFGDLAQAIQTSVESRRPLQIPTLKYHSIPSTAPDSSASHSSSRPDAYFVLAHEDRDRDPDGKKHWWRSMTLIGEFKKGETAEARNDNVCKLLWGMKMAMNEDFRRRFVFGFTIENTTTRLWFSDRSQVVVSDPFDFTKEPMRIVRLLYVFLYSEPTALGWDPTVTIHGASSVTRPNFAVHVGKRTYLTSDGPVYDRANSLMGRCTRVWNVQEMLDDSLMSKQTYVLKDTWTDADRRREGAAYDIFEQFKLDTIQRRPLDDILLSKVCHSDVEIAGMSDATTDLSDLKDKDRCFEIVWRGSDVKDPKPRFDDSTPVSSYHHSITHQLPPPHERRPMVHNRIVFKESGTPLHKIDSPARIFESISRVAVGLWVLHLQGWVHRDISLGNILVCPNGETKLIDFEYAKCKDATLSHPMRAGTANFVATEVDFQRYLYQPAHRLLGDHPAPTNASRPEAALALIQKVADISEKILVGNVMGRMSDSKAFTTKTFIYNPLHDVESLFWSGANMLLESKVVDCSSGPKRQRSDDNPLLWEQHEWARKLFHNRDERRQIMEEHGRFAEVVRTLDPRVRNLGGLLEAIREQLVEKYRVAEEDIRTIRFHDIAGDLYTLFIPHPANGIHVKSFANIRLEKISTEDLSEARKKRVKFDPTT